MPHRSRGPAAHLRTGMNGCDAQASPVASNPWRAGEGSQLRASSTTQIATMVETAAKYINVLAEQMQQEHPARSRGRHSERAVAAAIPLE